MTLEKIARKMRWERIIWSIGFLNIGAMLPQLWVVYTTKQTEALSLTFIGIYLVVQIGFALDGFLKRNQVLMIIMALSAAISMILISYVLYLRHIAS